MAAAILIATIVGALATVAALFIPWLNRRRRSHRIRIERIDSARHPDLVKALDLYARSLPENERDGQEEIVRWVQEVETETREGRCKLRDFFLAAKVGEKIAGFMYCQYYPNRKLLFISFLVVDSDMVEARRCTVSTALIRYISQQMRKGLRGCEGLVFELEYSDPSHKKKYDRCLARMRHFRALARVNGIIVKEILIEYRQPRLSLWDSQKEERQHLMYGRVYPPPVSTTISKEETKNVLAFLYHDIYGDQFEDEPGRDFQYRKYLDELYDKVIKQLPQTVPLS